MLQNPAMATKMIYILTLLFVSFSAFADSFRFHLVSDPAQLDPAKLSTSQSNYFYSTIFEGLYVYDDQKGLLPRGAKSCKWEGPLKLVCQLSHKKWSDSSPILAKHYVNAFRHLINPESYARRVDLLFSLKNAKKIYAKKLPVKQLGVIATSDYELQFSFDKPDSDFLYKLTSPVLVPWKKLPTKKSWKTNLYNGVYQIHSWNASKITLKPNPMYDQRKDRPDVEIYFIEDDSTALRLYNSGSLSFLRRMPATEIPFYKKTKDFVQLPVARFDYLGFNDPLIQHPKLREAMVHALDYAEFKKLFHALGRAGCPSLPESYFTETPCYDFNLDRAKSLLAQVDKKVLDKSYSLYFSTAGGEDIRRAVEWFQYQWKKHLGLKIEAKPLEHKMYLGMLKKGIKGIYRNGIPLDRPSCLAAIENFRSNSPENFLNLKSKGLDSKIDQLSKNLDDNKTKKICTEAVNTLLQEYRYIPLGRIHFSLLAKPEFTGWRLNELNQLDLSGIKKRNP